MISCCLPRYFAYWDSLVSMLSDSWLPPNAFVCIPCSHNMCRVLSSSLCSTTASFQCQVPSRERIVLYSLSFRCLNNSGFECHFPRTIMYMLYHSIYDRVVTRENKDFKMTGLMTGLGIRSLHTESKDSTNAYHK